MAHSLQAVDQPPAARARCPPRRAVRRTSYGVPRQLLWRGPIPVGGRPPAPTHRTAKSTAQQIAASVWGHPKQTRETLDSTKKSITHRLGMTRNFPAYWDDIQSEDKLEQVFNTMFLGSQGIEGGRLTSDVRARERL